MVVVSGVFKKKPVKGNLPSQFGSWVYYRWIGLLFRKKV